MRFAVLDKDNIVLNVIEGGDDWGETQPEPWTPEGGRLLATEKGSKGDRWDGTKFIPAPREVTPPTRLEELLAIGKDNWTDAQQKELIELLAQA